MLATVAVGWATRRGWTRQWPRLLGVLLLGHALIYLPGLIWLDVMVLQDLQRTLTSGLLPFLPGDMLKVLRATVSVQLLHRASARPG